MNNDTHDHLYKTHIITKILDMDQVEGIKLFLEILIFFKMLTLLSQIHIWTALITWKNLEP